MNIADRVEFRRLNGHYKKKFLAFANQLTDDTKRRWGLLDKPEEIVSFIFAENRGYKKQIIGLLDGEIVCFGSYYELINHRVFFEGILVRSDLQGRGIGTKLMEYLENLARKEGYTEARLEVFKDNEHGIKFYEKLGYRKNGHSETSWFMHKYLVDKHG